MRMQELLEKWGPRGWTEESLEKLRQEKAGVFHVVEKDAEGNVVEVTHHPNIITNEGLDHILSSGLAGGTQITAWYIALVKTNTTPAAAMTYATPTYTEIAAADVTETLRQAWTAGAVSGQSVDNSAAAATYTADATFDAYGAGLVGGGTGADTIADTAGGGTLYSFALFSTSKAMTAGNTLEITYTQNAADDGV